MPFDQETIKKVIEENLSLDINIPDDHKVALVTFINTDKAEVALATKINNRWSIDIIGSHSWSGNNEIGFISKLTW